MEKNKKRGKKGEIMWQIIIPLIVLLVTAAILIIFLRIIPISETVDKAACYQSVIQRSASLLGSHPTQYLMPLRCKTQEITINSIDEEQIKSEIANQMYDCWWMLGEGKYDFILEDSMQDMSIPFAGDVKTSCMICSIIKFGDKTKDAIQEIDIMDYLKNTKIPTKDFTYFEYFTDQADVNLATGLEAPTIKTDSDYTILFMNVRGSNYWNVIKKDAALLGIGGGAAYMAAGPGLLFKGIKAVIKIPVVMIATAVIATAVLTAQGIQSAENNEIVAGRCSGEWEGCSNLMLLPLKASEVAQVCNKIETIP